MSPRARLGLKAHFPRQPLPLPLPLAPLASLVLPALRPVMQLAIKVRSLARPSKRILPWPHTAIPARSIWARPRLLLSPLRLAEEAGRRRRSPATTQARRRPAASRTGAVVGSTRRGRGGPAVQHVEVVGGSAGRHAEHGVGLAQAYEALRCCL